MKIRSKLLRRPDCRQAGMECWQSVDPGPCSVGEGLFKNETMQPELIRTYHLEGTNGTYFLILFQKIPVFVSLFVPFFLLE